MLCYYLCRQAPIFVNFSNILIIYDSQSCLLFLLPNSFSNSVLFSLIYYEISRFSVSFKTIQFLWVTVVILGNKLADKLETSITFFSFTSLPKIFTADFLPIRRTTIKKAWLSTWRSLPANFFVWHRSISLQILPYPRFINLPKSTIIKFVRFRLRHHVLPTHSYRLSLNSSPFCTRHFNEVNCNICYILFHCSFLMKKQIIFFFLIVLFSAIHFLILNFSSTPVILQSSLFLSSLILVS